MPKPVALEPPARFSFYRAFKRALDRPGADRAVLLISLVLLAVSFDTGLSGDDYIHQLIAQGSHALEGFARPALDMYRFTDGRQTRALMREGVLEWWVDPEARLCFLRPVTALTHWLDYRLWPDQPWLMHAHSLAWAALLYLGLLRLYRALLAPSWVATLALFLYVLDDARGWFVSWVAARNAVVATALSVWSLWWFHRARKKAAPAGFVISPLLFALALLSGEGALSIAGYLGGYVLFLERGPLWRRLLALAPHAAVFLVWRAAYIALGYGVAHSGLYFDPSAEPVHFLHALIERGPVLLFSQAGGSWSDAWTVMFAFPNLQRVVVWLAVVYLAALGYALVPVAKRDPNVRFGLFGALFSLLPASATFVADRLLSWVAIGASIALARLIASYIDERETLLTSALRALLLPPLVLWLVFEKAVVDPLFVPSRARGNLVVRDSLDRAQAAIPTAASIRERHVIYMNPVAVPQAAYLQVERAGQGIPRPKSQALLATSETEVRVERVDDRTLRVRQRGGYLLSPGSRLLRNPERGFSLGARVRLDGLSIEVVELTADRRPAQILARFDRPLEDPSYLFLAWGTTGYLPFEPPPIGSAVTLPAADFLLAILGDAFRFPIDGRLPPPRDDHWVDGER